MGVRVTRTASCLDAAVKYQRRLYYQLWHKKKSLSNTDGPKERLLCCPSWSQPWPRVGSMASTQTAFPGILRLYSVLAQGCHITPVLHFQGFNPSLSPRPPLYQLRLCNLGSKVKSSARGWRQSTEWQASAEVASKFVLLLLPTPFLFAMSLFWNFCCHVWVWLGVRESQLLRSLYWAHAGPHFRCCATHHFQSYRLQPLPLSTLIQSRVLSSSWSLPICPLANSREGGTFSNSNKHIIHKH